MSHYMKIYNKKIKTKSLGRSTIYTHRDTKQTSLIFFKQNEIKRVY